MVTSSLREKIMALIVESDEWANVVIDGSETQTISARAYEAERKRQWFGIIMRPIIDLIMFWQPRHCLHAYVDWAAGTATPEP